MRINNTKLSLIVVLVFGLVFISCKDDNDNDEEGTKVLFFSVQDDLDLGQQLKQEIFDNPQDYPLLDSVQYKGAYDYIRGLKDSILNTGEIDYKETFAWEVYIIHDDNVLNAFAAPGGYIYFYTGLIRYLDTEDDLMGVMGHEMAHADLRHSAKQMQRQYGINILLSAILGNESSSDLLSAIAGTAGSLSILKFGRNAETESDLASVKYLAKTPYRCDGAATFFKKLSESGAGGGPVFLSTHPSPDDRVERISQEALSLSCDTTYYNPLSYKQFLDLLP